MKVKDAETVDLMFSVEREIIALLAFVDDHEEEETRKKMLTSLNVFFIFFRLQMNYRLEPLLVQV